MLKIWSKKEKQIDLAITNNFSIYNTISIKEKCYNLTLKPVIKEWKSLGSRHSRY